MFETTVENLDEMGIFELRQVARFFGVKSPTSKKMDQLKSEISAILNGTLKPEAESKRGRPPKAVGSNLSVNNQTNIPFGIRDILQKINVVNPTVNELVLECKSHFKENLHVTNSICGGFIILESGENKYFWCQEKESGQKFLVFIPKSVEHYSLLFEGDFVEGTFLKSNQDKCFVLTEIITINNIAIDQVTDRQTNDIDEISFQPGEKFEFCGKTISLGGRYIISGDSINDVFFSISQDLKSLTNYYLIFVGLEVIPEIERYVNVNCKTKFISAFSDPSLFSYETFYSALAHVISMAKDGKDVIVVMNDVAVMHSVLSSYFLKKADLDGLRYHSADEMVKKMFSLGRNLNTGSITTIATCQQKDFSRFKICDDLLRATTKTITIGN